MRCLNRTDSPAAERLNPRQGDVLFLLSKGLRNQEIAAQLSLSQRTVKYYVNQLFLIFDVTNRTELVGRWLGDSNQRAAEGQVRASAAARP
jgi:DNA-binding CsgD family transcriptional regulator